MNIAHDLGLTDLKTACEDHVIATMSVGNACTFLTSAMEIQEKIGGKCADSFVDRCIAYIGEHSLACVKSNGFLNLSQDAIVKIISSDFVSSDFFKSDIELILFIRSCVWKKKMFFELFLNGARIKLVLRSRWLIGMMKNVSESANIFHQLSTMCESYLLTAKFLPKRLSQPVPFQWNWSLNVIGSLHCNRIKCKEFQPRRLFSHQVLLTLTNVCNLDSRSIFTLVQISCATTRCIFKRL